MKKIIMILIAFTLMLSLYGCSSNNEELILRIYNCQDYIDEGLDDNGQKVSNSVMEDWQEWYYNQYGIKVRVVYDTFETNESMMNTLKTGKTTYDLVCPSDYTIQKMIRLNMIDEFDYELKDAKGNLIMTNYEYIAPYIRNLFKQKDWERYSIPYMWGTLGFIYNPEVIDAKDIEHWSILWNAKYKNMASAKDSVRDTYVVGVMYVYYDELMELNNKYETDVISRDEYNLKVSEIMNRCDTDTIKKVEYALQTMKKNLYGFEVDSGKSDIVTGKIAINFAWSGDAVFSIDVAEEENDVRLNYVVPTEGSNVWFDGWVMPKGANKELAQSFINYLCDPKIAVRNMNVIGYTSCVAGDSIVDLIDDWYGATLPEFNDETSTWWYDEVDLNINDSALEVKVIENEIYLGTQKVIDILSNIKDKEGNPYSDSYLCTYYEVDLTYFFEGSVSEEYLNEDGKIIVAVEERGRQFDTQYPDFETITRCAIMEDFGDSNDAVLEMWENVKIGDIPLYITFIALILIVLFIAAINAKYFIKKYQKAARKKS
ncbi:MAG: extracellular solute-binding protein [Bacilli bacterium]|nr:extracellular solute-binding protein [Bacilli bacterium]